MQDKQTIKIAELDTITQDSLMFFESELFKTVQLNSVFEDSKTFADATFKVPLQEIFKQYDLKSKSDPDFDLKSFITEYFYLPEDTELNITLATDDIKLYINELWKALERQATNVTSGSLLPLKYPYLVPGGRFREIYYWDSYFSSLGLIESGHVQLVNDMLTNFIDLQSRYGCIPNGNRTYYISRSQPPILALLVELLLPTKTSELTFLAETIQSLEVEYQFWMQGSEHLQGAVSEHRRVVKMPNGSYLNRYWDDNSSPRAESYREDMELSTGLPEDLRPAFYRNIRAACESGWDFSSRWLADSNNLSSIRTTRIVPVDLNCLLFKLEQSLSKYYLALGDKEKSTSYQKKAMARKSAIQLYMWSDSDGFYYDYDLDTKTHHPVRSLAGVLPLFVGLAQDKQAIEVANNIETFFLKEGGLITTVVNTKQQWDSPNGWAPLHWFCVQGLRLYQQDELAQNIMNNWLNTTHAHFYHTGKLMEKYNVCQQQNIASGGEYEVQEGFGWTNGVNQAFYKLLNV